MKKTMLLVLSLVLTAVWVAGCAEGATLDGGAAAGSAEAPAVDPAVTTLDQSGHVLGLSFRYSGAWEKLVDRDNTMSFRIPGAAGDYYAVITGETMNFADAEDPEQAKENWARNTVSFLGTDTVLSYTIGSPSYYYYAMDDGDEVIGLVFFNGDDFYDLQCSGPGGEESAVMGAWAELIDSLTLD